MTTLIEQLINKLGLHDEQNILGKTTELVRLLELRSTNVPLQINEYGKIVLCADIAAALLHIEFDKEQALKLSGLRKSHYVNNKRMFEKLLDLNKIVGVTDICIQLNLSEVSKKATELLELYKKVVVRENTDIDIEHPQYAAMAVFLACKLTKRKVQKTKLMLYSNLRPTQWLQLEQRWEKFLAKHYKDAMDISNLKKPHSSEQKQLAPSVTKAPFDGNSKSEVQEDYEKWKQRMLTQAENKLKEYELQQQQMETENIILGI